MASSPALKPTAWRGYAIALASAVGFAMLGVFAVWGYRLGLNTITMLTWRLLISGGVFTGWALATRASWPRGRDGLSVVGLGLMGYISMSWLFLEANKNASVGLASTVLYVYPALVVLFVAWAGWEALTRRRVLALAGSTAGAAMAGLSAIGGGSGPHPLLGALLAASAAVIYAGYTVVASRMALRVAPLAMSAVICVTAGLGLMGWGLLTRTLVPVPVNAWWVIAGLVGPATLIAVAFFFMAVRRIGPGPVSMISSVEPAAAAIMGYVLLGQVPNVWVWPALVLVVASILWLSGEHQRGATDVLETPSSRPTQSC